MTPPPIGGTLPPTPSFPHLTPSNHVVTSDATTDYNCIAWSLGIDSEWWAPGRKWVPPDWPETDHGIGALEVVFAAHGYIDCGGDDSLDPRFDKVALYGFMTEFTHAARQLPSGRWASKLGSFVDIEHDTPEAVTGPEYGQVMQIMAHRKTTGPNRLTLEELYAEVRAAVRSRARDTEEPPGT